MGVYVKGMKMPENCYQCKLRGVIDCSPLKGLSPYDAIKNCPLVEVKEPHGRFIDADALMLTIKDNMDYFKHEGVDACCYFLDRSGEPSAELWCVEEWIDTSKTVIEGSE